MTKDVSTFDLVIFDCDGVLIDSEMIGNRTHAAALTELGWPITVQEMIRRFTGMPDRDMYRLIEAEWGRALPADYDETIGAAVEQAYASELAAIDGIHEALTEIEAPVCVASSSTPDKLRLGLTVTGLYERFAPNIFSASQVARGKPAPDLFLFAAERMGADPARCLVIEDSLAGVDAACAAGMRVIGFTGGSHCGEGHGERLVERGAMLAFGDMRQLPELLARC